MSDDRPDSSCPPRGGAALPSEAIEREAAEWWVRRGQRLEADEVFRLHEWLAASPAHRAAFERFEALSHALDELPPERVSALRRVVAEVQPHTSRRPILDAPAAPRSRRWLLQGSLAAVAALVVGTLWSVVDSVLQQPTYSRDFATARGYQSRFTLPDGSELHLDTASEAHVSLYRDRREVRLTGGQAMFSVQPDADKPFHVLAGGTRVTVVGTRFSVRNVGAEVRVEVEEGKVRVAADEAGKTDAAVELTAGQVVRGVSGVPGEVARVEPGALAPWRIGRVVFDDTPLADAVSEFARYGDTQLVVRDVAAGRLRVTGSFEIARVDRFAQALPLVLPVRLVARNGQTEIVLR